MRDLSESVFYKTKRLYQLHMEIVMESKTRKCWPVIGVTTCLMFILAIVITAVSIDLARASAGSDQRSMSENKQLANRKEAAKMPVVQSTVATVKVTQGNFDAQVLKSDVPVLVDFYAEWCGPCHVQAPILDELARELDTARIATVDVDESPKLAARYRIRSIPTLLVFKNGKPVARHEGVASKEQLKRLLATG